MPAPDIILQKGFVLITPGSSVLGGVGSGTPLNFGTISIINDLCDKWVVGQNVMYVTQGQTLITYDSVEYAMVHEDNIFYKENPAP